MKYAVRWHWVVLQMDVSSVEDISRYCIEPVKAWINGKRPLLIVVIVYISSSLGVFVMLPWIKRL